MTVREQFDDNRSAQSNKLRSREDVRDRQQNMRQARARRAASALGIPPEPALPLFDSTPQIRFDGSDYDPAHDDARLTGQILRVFDAMRDARWRTLQEIADITRDPQASISAQLRHLRKARFGGHVVEKRARGDRVLGLFEYRLIVAHGFVPAAVGASTGAIA